MARLGDICTVNMGQSPDSATYNEVGRGLPFFQGNADFGRLHPAVRVWCSEPTKIAHTGDILISVRAPIGAMNVADQDCCIGRGLAAIQVNENICDPQYLWYAIQSKVSDLNAKGTGSTFKAISKSTLTDTEVLLVPLDAQKNIARVLSNVENSILFRKEQLSKLDELVKARFVEMFENNTYPKVKVSTVCDFITKGTTPPNDLISEEYSSDKVPYLKVYNLSFNGELLFDTAPQYISENIHNGMLARSKVYPNDVLMNIVGPPLGKFSLVTDEFPEWNINQAIAIFRAKEKINPKYLLSALMQPEVLNPFLRQAVGIRQLNLSLSQCRDLEIFLPPLSLQNQFAAFVAEVDKSKVEVQKALDQTQLLFNSLMQQYFG